jgi:hypothetical protein
MDNIEKLYENEKLYFLGIALKTIIQEREKAIDDNKSVIDIALQELDLLKMRFCHISSYYEENSDWYKRINESYVSSKKVFELAIANYEAVKLKFDKAKAKIDKSLLEGNTINELNQKIMMKLARLLLEEQMPSYKIIKILNISEDELLSIQTDITKK